MISQLLQKFFLRYENVKAVKQRSDWTSKSKDALSYCGEKKRKIYIEEVVKSFNVFCLSKLKQEMVAAKDSTGSHLCQNFWIKGS